MQHASLSYWRCFGQCTSSARFHMSRCGALSCIPNQRREAKDDRAVMEAMCEGGVSDGLFEEGKQDSEHGT